MVPNSWIQVFAFTAASLLRRFTELVEEFETLHSVGMTRPSQRRTTRSALRLPNNVSAQNSPRPGTCDMFAIVRGGTSVSPAARSAPATAPSWVFLASLRLPV